MKTKKKKKRHVLGEGWTRYSGTDSLDEFTTVRLNFEKEAINICKKIFSWDTTGTTAKIHIEFALKRRHNATLRMVHKHVCGCKESADGCPGQKAVKELTVKP